MERAGDQLASADPEPVGVARSELADERAPPLAALEVDQDLLSTLPHAPADEAALEAGIRAGLPACGLAEEVPPALARRLADYLALLDRWNAAYNLTAVRDPSEMIPRHVFDSLAVDAWADAAILAARPERTARVQAIELLENIQARKTTLDPEEQFRRRWSSRSARVSLRS